MTNRNGKTKNTSTKKERISIKARYDAATTNRNNQKHWSVADFLSADLDANAAVRKELRIRARYEVQNNSYAKGIVSTLANECIGTGARIQINNAPDETATTIERDFMAWCKAVSLTDKLRTARFSKCVDGESFLLLTTNNKVNDQIKLDVQLIDADRVTSTNYSFKEKLIDGITLDSKGNVVSYSVYDEHPSENVLNNISTIPAKYIIHLYNQDRPGQHRGISELAPALELFGQLRDYTAATISAAQAAACITGVIQTTIPAAGEAEEVEPLESFQLEQNQLLTLPAGWTIAMNKAEQPTSTYKDFKNEILSEIARCLNIPYNIAKQNSENSSYASSRLDTQLFFKTIQLEQNYFIHNALERIFKAWLDEYTLQSKIVLPDFSYSFMFDGNIEHSDPLKIANATAVELKNYTTTLAEVYAKKGKNYEAELRQIAYERSLMKELGLTLDDVVNESSIDNTEDIDNEQQSFEN